MTLLAAVVLIVVGLPLSCARDQGWRAVGFWCAGAAFAFAATSL